MSTILEIQIYKLIGIAQVLEDEGYHWEGLEVLAVAHEIELKIFGSDPVPMYVPENFE